MIGHALHGAHMILLVHDSSFPAHHASAAGRYPAQFVQDAACSFIYPDALYHDTATLMG